MLAALEQLDRRPRPPQVQAPAASATPIAPVEPAASAAPARSYHTGIRSRGPLLGLIVPVMVGVTGLMLLRNSDSMARGVAGFVLVMLAAPVLTVVGVPFRSGAGLYFAAAAGSAMLWVLLGVLAARRSTRATVAVWSKFWGEYLVLVVSVWVGVAVAMAAANLVLGRALL